VLEQAPTPAGKVCLYTVAFNGITNSVGLAGVSPGSFLVKFEGSTLSLQDHGWLSLSYAYTAP
jgi:hypothetical protein